jgi:hypothetical protein
MPVYEVTAPDGKKYDVTAPAGATQDQVINFAKLQFDTLKSRADAEQASAQERETVSPVKDSSFFDNLRAGTSQGMGEVKTGLEQRFAGNSPESRNQVEQNRQLDKPLLQTAGGALGRVLGKTALMVPAMMVPGANGYLGATLIGAGAGALEPVGNGESVGKNMLAGAAGGVAGQGVANRLAAVVSPTVRPSVRTLMDEGVTPTPGQILGGSFQKVEDKLTSVPIMGDAISAARTRGLDDFNRAAYNRVLKPIGEQSDGAVGREGIQAAADKISGAYNALLPKLSFKADQQFGQEVANLHGMAQTLPPAQAAQFETILKTQLLDKITPAGLMNGESLKTVESELGRLGRSYSGSADAGQRELGRAISELQSSVRSTLVRSNPAQAAELQKINEGFANLVRVERAAGMQTAQYGVFTPNLLSNAVKAGDSSARKNAFAKGNALMQDLSDAGKDVLASKYPDSGTAGRLTLGVGAIGAGLASPLIPGTLAAGATPYLPGVNKLVATLLTQRPELAAPLAELVKKGSPLLAGGTAAAALQQR